MEVHRRIFYKAMTSVIFAHEIVEPLMSAYYLCASEDSKVSEKGQSIDTLDI